jgi:S-adenosylmethionine synthetase
VDTQGTGTVSEQAIGRAVRRVFDLTPAGIIRDLDLLRPIYTETSSLGHFGRWRDPEVFLWEATTRADDLATAAGEGAN